MDHLEFYDPIGSIEETRGRVSKGELYFKSSKSSSSTTSNTENNIQDRRIGGGDGAIIAAEGSSVVIESLDAEVAQNAINQTASIAAEANKNVTEVALEGIDLAGSAFSETIEFAEASNEETLKLLGTESSKNRDFIENTFEEFTQQQLSTEERQSQQVFIIGLVFIGAVAAIFITKELSK